MLKLILQPFDAKNKTSFKYKKAFENFTKTDSYKLLYEEVFKELHTNTLLDAQKGMEL